MTVQTKRLIAPREFIIMLKGIGSFRRSHTDLVGHPDDKTEDEPEGILEEL